MYGRGTMIWIGSPNFWEGRQSKKIDRVIVHWMDGTLASTDQVFQDKQRQTSAHYGIEDIIVHQYVKESNTAWHSGNASMNLCSIGIEHSASPDRPASAQTIDTSARLIADICKRYSIPCDRKHIIKHSEVPYATECPGTIPIDQIVDKANAILKGEGMAVITVEAVVALARATTGKQPSTEEDKKYINKPATQENIDGLITYWAGKSRVTDLLKVSTQSVPIELKPGVYEVK